MAFASIYVPHLMTQAIVRSEPPLRDRAIALIDGIPPLCNVVAANDSALRAGIKLGMSKSQAAQFCLVEIRNRSREQEKAAHAALLDLGWSVSPWIEDTAPDTIVLDLTGLVSLFGSDKDIAIELVRRASGLGLAAHVAIASKVDVALHAARGFPGITLIPSGEESKRLSLLSVSALSPAVEILEILERWGVRTCGALAALPVLQLSERLGQEGVRLHKLARCAISRSLVLAGAEMCFEEEMALDYALAELEPLAFLLGRLLDQLCARLATRSLAASAIRLRFDLRDSFEKDFQDLGANSPPKPASPIYEKVLSLPVPMQDSKMLLKLLRLQLQSDPPQASIVKLFLAADPARPRATQGGLFFPTSPDPEKLELTVARLANLVGNSNIGSPQLVDTHRPGEFRMSRFVPVCDAPQIHRKNGIATTTSLRKEDRDPQLRPAATGFRVFRPELPATVKLCEDYPARIYFHGIGGNVVAASGPWKTSGDWWREDPWQQDEWEVDIRFDSFSGRRERAANARAQDGLYRIYYDSIRAAWFVRGRYD
jgi:protein ImuB